MKTDRNMVNSVLSRAAAALDAVGVEYMVTGSVAAGFFAVPRASADIDIVIRAHDSDRPFLTKVLSEDFVVDPDVIKDAFLQRSMFNTLDEQTGIKVDFILLKGDHNPGDPFARRVEFEVGGTTVKMISPEDLIIAKLIWAKDSHSEMQLRDVHNILHYPGLDRVYVGRMVEQLGLTALLEEAEGERHAT